jgi:AcrR family transcriptional regulator
MPPTKVRSAPARAKGDREGVQRDILEAARALVAEVGADFTTQDLIKRAGVALQTFYRHFGGKDQLLLALIASQISGFAEQIEASGQAIADPIERLHSYIDLVLDSVRLAPGASPRFITSEHWRLHQLYPDEVAAATQPFADLIQRALDAAIATGQIDLTDPARTAWIINKLVMAIFHHYAFMPDDPALATAADDVWQFCLGAIGA